MFGLIAENDNVEVLGFLNGTKGLFEARAMKLDRKLCPCFEIKEEWTCCVVLPIRCVPGTAEEHSSDCMFFSMIHYKVY